MKKHVLITFVMLLSIFLSAFGQNGWIPKLDSLLSLKQPNPYNGIVLVSKGSKQQYFKTFGFKDLNHTIKIKSDDKFVIGSISKQITAVLILQQYQKGALKLSDPITKYFSFIPQDWDTITIDQLLSHTHGITKLDKPLAFTPGSTFMYSQHGYELLAQILEKVTKVSFAEQSKILFKNCGMNNTCHPSYLKTGELVTCFTGKPDGSVFIETRSLEAFPAAGAFVSTACDMAIWNKCVFGGRLLNDSTLKLMISPKKNAVRDHPVFGKTIYGYGITIDNSMDIEQYGQTGFADGFACMNFYFPTTKTSIIAFENIVYNPDDMTETFYYHKQILDLLKKTLSRHLKRNRIYK
jgi:D-alanyl-D-alanine carboxypeptidase